MDKTALARPRDLDLYSSPAEVGLQARILRVCVIVGRLNRPVNRLPELPRRWWLGRRPTLRGILEVVDTS